MDDFFAFFRPCQEEERQEGNYRGRGRLNVHLVTINSFTFKCCIFNWLMNIFYLGKNTFWGVNLNQNNGAIVRFLVNAREFSCIKTNIWMWVKANLDMLKEGRHRFWSHFVDNLQSLVGHGIISDKKWTFSSESTMCLNILIACWSHHQYFCKPLCCKRGFLIIYSRAD